MRSSQIRPLAEPKPFFWIPLEYSDRKHVPVSHDRFRGLNGYLDLNVKVQSDYLYVGSGSILLNERNQSYYAFARRGGKLVIPATSMKGPVRSIAEAISGSCVSQASRRDKIRGLKDPCRIRKDQEASSELCPACGLFGTTGYMGRVHFIDAVPVGELKPKIEKISDLWPPRVAMGRKFYQAKTFVPQNNESERNHRFLEAVPKNSVFATKLFFENTSAGEMGLLIRSLGIGFPENDSTDPTYLVPIKIGGAKPRCLGAVRFEVKGLHMLSNLSGNIFSALSEVGKGVPIIKTVREWLMDESLLDDVAWLRFREGAKAMSEPCPKELY